MLGPVIGGLLAEVYLHAPFFAAAGLAAASLVLGLLVLPETLTPANRRAFDLARSNPFTALWTAVRLPALRRILLCFFILAVAMNVYAAIWACYGPVAFGWTPTMVGLSLTIYGIFLALGQALLVGPLIRRLAHHALRRPWRGGHPRRGKPLPAAPPLPMPRVGCKACRARSIPSP